MSSEAKRVAIVTGASRGIGAEVARRLAADGFAVVVNYRVGEHAARGVVAGIETAGGRAVAVQADVSIPDEVRRLFDTAEKAFRGIDVLVNNAGLRPNVTIAEMDDATFDHTLGVNLKGTFYALREAANRVRPGGRIVNFSSTVLGLQLPTYGAYNASKAGVEALTVILAKELRGRNVTVNAIAPGPTSTDLFLEGKSQEQIDWFTKMSPLERLGTPADIAAAVSFLTGPDGGWVNGQVLHVNGGML